MSAFTSIDLSKLPAPDVVETLSFEAILAEMISDLQSRDPAFSATVESDPVYKLLEVVAYRELVIRQRVNDASRAVMLAYAGGADLEQLGALFGVARLVLVPANPSLTPPSEAVMEGDEDFRRRIQLSLEGFSTAGPEGAYIFHGLGADGDVLDVSATSPNPGEVVVAVLSRTGSGTASAGLLATVEEALNADTVRPLTDLVTVQSAAIVNFAVTATIYTYPGPDSQPVIDEANAALDVYLESVHRIGQDVTISGIYGALHRPGVQRVELTAPTANIVISELEASFCNSKTISYGGTDE
jgi:phage-related baseplate assembly protein